MDYTTRKITIRNVNNIDTEVSIFHLVLSDFTNIENKIKDEIVDIWEADLGYSIQDVKKDIFNVISSKSDEQKHGICAEFFMHLFLRDLGYKQKCVFSNLEEKSMKKGLDGLYEYTNDFWIAESKCAITENKHKEKIKEALNDIENKVNNSYGNNPWKNALHHIMIRNDEKNNSLTQKIRQLSSDYINAIKHDSSEFNLIPTSTLFINNNQNDDDIKKEIEEVISKRKIKSMIILCVNNDIFNEFIDYLKG